MKLLIVIINIKIKIQFKLFKLQSEVAFPVSSEVFKIYLIIIVIIILK